MSICRTCGKGYKGHRCKDCRKKYMSDYNLSEKERLIRKNYRDKRERPKITEQDLRKKKEWENSNILRRKAFNKIHYLLKSGKLTKPRNCPKCTREVCSFNLYIQLNEELEHDGWLCSWCQGLSKMEGSRDLDYSFLTAGKIDKEILYQITNYLRTEYFEEGEGFWSNIRVINRAHYEGEMVALTLNEKPLGFLVYSLRKDYVVVDILHTKKQQRHKGVGRILLEEFSKYIKSTHGLNKIAIECISSKGFWVSLGFKDKSSSADETNMEKLI